VSGKDALGGIGRFLMKTVRIGGGAGFSGDRIEPAVELAKFGKLNYLAFECLGERTIALAQARKQLDPSLGYDPLLIERVEAVLPHCADEHIRIVTNMGAANPQSAAKAVANVARRLGLTGLRIAAITGDDVLGLLEKNDYRLIERPGWVSELRPSIISANAYIGAEPIVEALRGGADVIITGRVGDPALFLGPMIYEFGWAFDDWPRLGRGTIIGHLMECAGQLTGGYYADPGFKDVPDLARLGFPIAEVDSEGTALFSKVDGSGGRLDVSTCTEQLLYEILDPTAYYQPDVIADLSSVSLKSVGPNRVAFRGGTGVRRPDTLKVSIGYQDGYVGEGQISYAGPGCLERGNLALDIVKERISLVGLEVTDLRLELIGVNAVNLAAHSPRIQAPPEVRARVIGRTKSKRDAERLGAEVESLYTNGPSGGGGVTKGIKQVTAVLSTLVPRTEVVPSIHYEVA
jgi:hypothetical protein